MGVVGRKKMGQEYGRDEATDCCCCLCAQTGQAAIIESCGKFDKVRARPCCSPELMDAATGARPGE